MDSLQQLRSWFENSQGDRNRAARAVLRPVISQCHEHTGLALLELGLGVAVAAQPAIFGISDARAGKTAGIQCRKENQYRAVRPSIRSRGELVWRLIPAQDEAPL